MNVSAPTRVILLESKRSNVNADRLSNAPGKMLLMLFDCKYSSVKADRPSNAPEGMLLILFEFKYSSVNADRLSNAPEGMLLMELLLRSIVRADGGNGNIPRMSIVVSPRLERSPEKAVGAEVGGAVGGVGGGVPSHTKKPRLVLL